MVNVDEFVRDKAILRLSKILNVTVNSIADGNMRFKDMSESNFVSFFKRNKFDIILDDIRDVSSVEALKKLESGNLVIETVEDYINHMINCYSESPKMVDSVLD